MRAIEPQIGNMTAHPVILVVGNNIKKSTVFDLGSILFFISQDLFNPTRDIGSTEPTGVSGKINLSTPHSFEVFSCH